MLICKQREWGMLGGSGNNSIMGDARGIRDMGDAWGNKSILIMQMQMKNCWCS